MKLQVTSGGVPAGSYIARFVGVEPTTSKIGEGLKWVWEVTSGPHAGAKVSRITDTKPTLKNACGRMLAGVMGKALSDGDVADPAVFVGKSYCVIVGPSESGATRVESVSLPPT